MFRKTTIGDHMRSFIRRLEQLEFYKSLDNIHDPSIYEMKPGESPWVEMDTFQMNFTKEEVKKEEKRAGKEAVVKGGEEGMAVEAAKVASPVSFSSSSSSSSSSRIARPAVPTTKMESLSTKADDDRDMVEKLLSLMSDEVKEYILELRQQPPYPELLYGCISIEAYNCDLTNKLMAIPVIYGDGMYELESLLHYFVEVQKMDESILAEAALLHQAI